MLSDLADNTCWWRPSVWPTTPSSHPATDTQAHTSQATVCSDRWGTVRCSRECPLSRVQSASTTISHSTTDNTSANDTSFVRDLYTYIMKFVDDDDDDDDNYSVTDFSTYKHEMNEWMNVFILTSDKPQMKLQRMDTKCYSLHNKNYSLQYDLVWVFIQ